MHGRVKVRTTAEQEALKKIERDKKLAQYKAAIGLVFRKRKDGVWDDKLLMVTEQMVLQNPDINTIWNIRREAFQNNDWPQEERTERLTRELTLTENCLRENPKSYGVWHHRCWVIDHLPEPDWKTELSLCAKCLNLDDRNFHCWDYRQYVVQKAGISDAEEFDFSTTKILNNFSNYSSWHYRSKILSKMFPDETGELPIRADKHKEELDLVMNATFTDPNDSSAWFYQRWLLDCSESKSNTLFRARVSSTSATLVLFKEIKITADNVKFLKDGTVINSVVWESPAKKQYSKIWIATFAEHSTDAESMSIKIDDNTYDLYRSEKKDVWLYKIQNSTVEKHNKAQLKEQMESYQQLSEMEPNNKWSLLTGIYLMKNYNLVEYNTKILDDLNALLKVDKLRSNYYNDLRSKCIMDYTLQNIWQSESEGEFCSTIDLSGLDLTILYNEHYLSFFEEINLGANKLTNSLHRLNALQECKKLSLSSNELKSLKRLPILKNLETLSLRNNDLSNVDEILELVKHHPKLKMLDIRDNNFEQLDTVVAQISNACSTLELLVD